MYAFFVPRLKESPHFFKEEVLGECPVKGGNALGRLLSELSVRSAHSLVKAEGKLVETVFLSPFSSEPYLRRDVQEEGEVGEELLGGETVEEGKEVAVYFPPSPLVG